jgi:sialate O-acetylesterase
LSASYGFHPCAPDKAQAAQTATLELGRANEKKKLGQRRAWAAARNSPTPPCLAARTSARGDNSIVLNLFCSWKNCGLSGPASTRLIRFADGSSVMLDQPWHYKPVADLIAPQLPWGPMHGVGLQYNGMIAPIGPYGVKGAIWYQGESNLYFAQNYQKTVAAMMADWRKQPGAALPL